MSFSSFSSERLITWKRASTGRTCSTWSIQREVIQAQGHSGSNQKSTMVGAGDVTPESQPRGREAVPNGHEYVGQGCRQAGRRRVIAGRYALKDEVGRGGMGIVWRAEDEILGRDVALKRVGLSPGGATPDLERAAREARLAATLNHPNVVAVFDLAEQGDEQWLVMEYVESRTLADLVKAGPLPADQAARLLCQAANALAAAHRAGIVHRDVKPSNILVTRDGQVKLSDFGIARAHGDHTLTQTGMVTGSPAYLAPEVASGQSATAASDVWSLGATLYHALTGRPPYDVGPNVVSTLYQIVHEEPPVVEDAGWLAPLLSATMAKDPASRWSMQQVAAYLCRESGRDSERTQPIAVTPPPERRQSGSWRVPLVGGGVLAVLLLGVLGWWLLSPGDGQRPAAAGTRTGQQQTQSSSPTSTPSSAAPVTAAEMRAFVTDYLNTVTSDPQA